MIFSTIYEKLIFRQKEPHDHFSNVEKKFHLKRSKMTKLETFCERSSLIEQPNIIRLYRILPFIVTFEE